MALILSVVLMVVAGVLSLELWGWLPALSRRVIWLATLSLPRERRELRRREFGEELKGHYAERRVAGLAWTLRLTPICAWERATSLTLRRSHLAWLTALSAISYVIVVDPQALAASQASQNVVVLGGLCYLYWRHNRSFYFVRNMLVVVLTIGSVHALGEHLAAPIVRPFLVSEGVMQAALQTAYALLIGWPLARLVRLRALRVLWLCYPFNLVMVALIASASNGEALLAAITGALITGIAAYTSRWIAGLRRTPA
jgi:hypothetical protein